MRIDERGEGGDSAKNSEGSTLDVGGQQINSRSRYCIADVETNEVDECVHTRVGQHKVRAITIIVRPPEAGNASRLETGREERLVHSRRCKSF